MPSKKFAFTKEERLSKKKLIDELFKNGSSFYLQPFKVLFLEMKEPQNPTGEKTFPAQILIAVSSKNFKRAVDRNKIRRLIREAYRLNKQLLYEALISKNVFIQIGLLYTSKKIESFSFIQGKVVSVLKKLATQNEMVERDSD